MYAGDLEEYPLHTSSSYLSGGTSSTLPGRRDGRSSEAGPLVKSCHKSTLGRSGRYTPKLFGGRPATPEYLLEARGAYVASWRHLARSRSGSGRRGPGASRGVVTEWSARSRRRAKRGLASLQLGESSSLMFVVLTVPDVLSEHEHARRLLVQRLRAWRLNGQRLEAWWGKEYQRRGAVHYNLFVVVPKGCEALFSAKLRGYLVRCQRWGWYTCEQFRRGSRAAMGYALKYGVSKDKAYQQVLPAGVEAAGRWWGVVGTRGDWRREALTRSQFFDLARARHAWLRSKGIRLYPAVEARRRAGEARSLSSFNGPPNLAAICNA